ncbi:DUF3892 domain-containing protein [Pseudomonas costantinii]|uniref:DUF3892 domain-containing protein n=1 Tax=Pseudomonas costantinii TaxID=168469 RepID=UPI0015A46901|nr:DUF3892 domain-containing protein [Pseudomonas costantinii]
MVDVQVTRITQPSVNSSHEHIAHLASTVNQWHSTREQLIASVDNSLNAFYVTDPVNKVLANVVIVRESGRAPYLHSGTEGQWHNKLLSLD